MKSRKLKLAVVVGVIAMTSAPTAASGVSVLKGWQGADYSINSSNGLAISACDMENDSHDVSADYVRSGSATEWHVIDGTYGGSCANTNLATVIYKHRAVELIPIGTDAYGSWVYPV